jgi:hypothetical protein
MYLISHEMYLVGRFDGNRCYDGDSSYYLSSEGGSYRSDSD